MPPKPASENTSNREYYRVSEETDAPDDDVISLPSQNSSPKHKSPAKPSNESKKIASASTESLIAVTLETPSPTPSDLVLQVDPEHVSQMQELNEQMKKDGVHGKERKKALLELKGELQGGVALAKEKGKKK